MLGVHIGIGLMKMIPKFSGSQEPSTPEVPEKDWTVIPVIKKCQVIIATSSPQNERLDLSNRIQVTYDTRKKPLKDCIVKCQKSSSVAPLKSKDGTVILKDSVDVRNRWIQHFTVLLHNLSVINDDVINNLHQLDIINGGSPYVTGNPENHKSD